MSLLEPVTRRQHSLSTKWNPLLYWIFPYCSRDAWCRTVIVQNCTYFVWRHYRSRWRCLRKYYRSHHWHMTHRLSPVRGTGTEQSESVQLNRTQTLIIVVDGLSLTHTYTELLQFASHWQTAAVVSYLSHCSNHETRHCSIFILYI